MRYFKHTFKASYKNYFEAKPILNSVYNFSSRVSRSWKGSKILIILKVSSHFHNFPILHIWPEISEFLSNIFARNFQQKGSKNTFLGFSHNYNKVWMILKVFCTSWGKSENLSPKGTLSQYPSELKSMKAIIVNASFTLTRFDCWTIMLRISFSHSAKCRSIR